MYDETFGNTLSEKEITLFGQQYNKELMRLHHSQEQYNHWARMIMSRQRVDQIINHLKGRVMIEDTKERAWIDKHKFSVVVNEDCPDVEYLVEEPKKKSRKAARLQGRGVAQLQVVPREAIFDTLLSIHLDNNHSTLRETLHLVRERISNIPRYLVHKFILLCPVCSNNGASSNGTGLPYTPSRRCTIKARKRRKLMDQFQVDILDMQQVGYTADLFGSKLYTHTLHCMDHITGFHWLMPVTQVNAEEIAKNLVDHIFCMFGFPAEMSCDRGEDFCQEIINDIYKLWPKQDEVHISNRLEGAGYKNVVSYRCHKNIFKFIDEFKEKKSLSEEENVPWSMWLSEIAFLMNSTVLDVRTGKTPFEKVFRDGPVTPAERGGGEPEYLEGEFILEDAVPLDNYAAAEELSMSVVMQHGSATGFDSNAVYYEEVASSDHVMNNSITKGTRRRNDFDGFNGDEISPVKKPRVSFADMAVTDMTPTESDSDGDWRPDEPTSPPIYSTKYGLRPGIISAVNSGDDRRVDSTARSIETAAGSITQYCVADIPPRSGQKYLRAILDYEDED